MVWTVNLSIAESPRFCVSFQKEGEGRACRRRSSQAWGEPAETSPSRCASWRYEASFVVRVGAGRDPAAKRGGSAEGEQRALSPRPTIRGGKHPIRRERVNPAKRLAGTGRTTGGAQKRARLEYSKGVLVFGHQDPSEQVPKTPSSDRVLPVEEGDGAPPLYA